MGAISQNISDLASLIGVQAVAIIGVSLILISTAWKGFENTYFPLSSQQKKTVITNSVIPFVIIIVLLAGATISGVYAPTLVAAIVLLIMILITIILIISTPIIIILRKVKKTPKSQEPDVVCTFYFFSVLLLASCILCTIGALMGVTSTMLDIHIGPYERENFEFGRWLVWDGTFFFATGIVQIGLAYITDKIRRRKTK